MGLSALHGVRDGGHEEAHGADRVVVAGDDVVHAVRVAVGVDDAEDLDAELVGFGHGDAFVVHIDDEQRIRQTAHLLDAAEAALQLLHQARLLQRLLLRQHVERAVLGLGLQVRQATDGLPDGLVVGQRAAEPALVDERHADALRLLADDLRGGPLGADEEDLVAPPCESLDLGEGRVEGRYGGL